MAVAILAPRNGDTVTSPVPVTVSYTFASGTFTLNDKVGTFAAPTPPNLSGMGFDLESVTVSAPGAYTVTAGTTPSTGGSDSQDNVTVTSGTPPVIIVTVMPSPPPPPPPPLQGMKAASTTTTTGNTKWYDVKGKSKDSGTPKPDKVTCQAYQVDLTTTPPTWTAVGAPVSDTPNNGGNWHVKLSFDRVAGFSYAIQVTAFVSGSKVGQHTTGVTN